MATKTNTAGGDGRSLVDALPWRAHGQPHKTAFHYLNESEGGRSSLTYEQLDRGARAVAAHLREVSSPGERALLLFQCEPEFITSFLGCLYAGLIAVPVSPPRPHGPLQQLRAISSASGAALALTTGGLFGKLKERFGEAPELGALLWLKTDELDAADSVPAARPAPEAVAFLQFTSGSTAAPRGVKVTHGNLAANLAMIQRGFDIGSDFVGVSWLPHYHDMGLIGTLLTSLFVGGTTHLMSPAAFLQRPARWLQAATAYEATTIGGPNFGYDYCVKRVRPEQCEGLDLSTLRHAFCGAEPVRSETLAAFAERFSPYGFRRRAFFPCYGLAEATLFVTGARVDEPPRVEFFDAAALEKREAAPCAPADRGARALVSCGRPGPPGEVLVVERDSREPCPERRLGEIWVAGPHVAGGYWGEEGETAETFMAFLGGVGGGPFLRTGDIGFLDGGELFVTGRCKDLIIIDGRNLYPQDIELTVRRLDPTAHLGRCAAFSVDVEGGERLVILLELERRAIAALGLGRAVRQQPPEAAGPPPAEATHGAAAALDPVAEMSRAIRAAVSEEHGALVHDLVMVPAGCLPVTTSGKTKRQACREAYLKGRLGSFAGAGRARFVPLDAPL